MAFTEEFIQENGLEENQVKAITSFYEKNIIPELKKDWDGKANQNAEGILQGASKYASQKFGVELEREQGEKWGDYLARISENALEIQTKSIQEQKQELEDKLKNFKGSEELKQKYENALSELDNYKKKVATLEPLEGIDVKYKEANEKLTLIQKEFAYTSVKPNFPDTVNKYEAEAKWNEWKKNIDNNYDIQLIDGKPFAIDKENEHKKIELSELISNDKNITELLQGRQQRGSNAKPANLEDIEGVPFKVPENLDSTERTKLIREYLAKEGISITSPEYASKFAELNLAIAKKK